ncbi:AfsR/SARP family transcriptional regulator [Streptomyces sp. NPDC003691]
MLGNLSIRAGERHLEPRAKKVGILLAALLLRANQVVSIDRLVLEIWGERPPRRATAALHVYVSQLRKLIPADEISGHPIVTRSPGYLIQVNSGDLDVDVFRDLLARGRRLMRTGDYQGAIAAFEQAQDFPQGDELARLGDGPIVSGFATWLAEVRLELLEMTTECRLMLDHHHELVPGLHELLREFPLHEAFYRQLMLALYRCDRRADALQTYRRARALLQNEIGLEPCASLRELHHAILHDDPRALRLSPVA